MKLNEEQVDALLDVLRYKTDTGFERVGLVGAGVRCWFSANDYVDMTKEEFIFEQLDLFGEI